MTKAIILDRDGTLIHPIYRNGEFRSPTSTQQLYFLPNAIEFCSRLKELGFELFVVTNQPDVGLGQISMETSNEINEIVKERLMITSVYTCYHSKNDNCGCRKPNSGLVKAIIRDFGEDIRFDWVIGDRTSDFALAKVIGCKAIQLPCAGIERDVYAGPYALNCKSLIECLFWIEKGLDV